MEANLFSLYMSMKKHKTSFFLPEQISSKQFCLAKKEKEKTFFSKILPSSPHKNQMAAPLYYMGRGCELLIMSMIVAYRLLVLTLGQ